jgi:photosystem II stability/assembly factor-like uncharacterized protein
VISSRSGQALMLAIAVAGARLVAVGERGIVLWSDDHGQRWRQAQVPVSVTLTGVYFIDAHRGWAVGHSGVLLATEDGGLSWQRRLDGRQVAQLALTAAQALPEGEGRAAAMRDAQFLVADGPDKPLFDVHFRSRDQGLAVGAYGQALASADGGKSWRWLGRQVPNPKGKHLYRIARFGGRTWLAGEQGALFMADEAASFTEVVVPYNGTLFGLLPISDAAWLAYGLRGNVLLTEDDGHSWTKAVVPEPVTVTHGIRTSSGSLVIADQSGRLLVSLDGRAFKSLPAPAQAPINAVIETADRYLVVATVRGMVRLAPTPTNASTS